MNAIIKTTKTDYKLKNVCFDNGNLISEEGEVIELIKILELIFGEEPFDISASNKDTVNYDITYFEQNVNE